MCADYHRGVFAAGDAGDDGGLGPFVGELDHGDFGAFVGGRDGFFDAAKEPVAALLAVVGLGGC